MATVDQLLAACVLLAALGSGLMAGTFFAFSAFVMRALARLPAGDGIAAMQSINIAVINPLFLGVFLGTAAACAGAVAGAAWRWDRPEAAHLLAGGLLYLIGTFGVTTAFNVPLNDGLTAVGPGDPDGPRRWSVYV